MYHIILVNELSVHSWKVDWNNCLVVVPIVPVYTVPSLQASVFVYIKFFKPACLCVFF